MSRIFHEKIKDKRRWEKIRRQVIQRDNFRCRACGRILNYYNFEIDHVKPLHMMDDKEDPYDKKNLQTLCDYCHSAKSARENNRRVQTKEEMVWTDFVNELMEE